MNASLRSSKLPEHEYIYWVNSLKFECSGVGRMQCLKIQKGNELNKNEWKFFYDKIDGFEYEQGYIYKIIVKEDKIQTEQVRADASSIKYTLIKILDKKFDEKIKLHDTWELESIRGEALVLHSRLKRPQIEINIKTNRISGNDGCNNFTGRITAVDSKKITFGTLAGTRKACIDMEISDRFSKNISKACTYSVKKSKLHLFDDQGTELLVFRKID